MLNGNKLSLVQISIQSDEPCLAAWKSIEHIHFLEIYDVSVILSISLYCVGILVDPKKRYLGQTST